MDKKKRAAIVVRVSTVRQSKFTTGIESQLKRCRQYCESESNRFDVLEELTDTISGTVPIADRPAGKRLYDLIDNHLIDAIVFYTNDRTARDDFTIEYLLLKSHCYANGVELHYADTGKDDNTMSGNIVGFIKGQVAAEERRKIAERTKRGKVTLAESGKWPGSNHPRYGYTKTGSGKSAVLSIFTPQEDVIKRMFAECVERRGTTRGIAVMLNRDGIPASRGGIWEPIKVLNVLTCKAYTGRWSFAGIEVYLPHLKIIDDKTFALAQVQIEHNKAFARRNCKHEYLLAGRISCHCGYAMSGNGGTDKRTGKDYYYYTCNEYNKSVRVVKMCHEKPLRADISDQSTWEELKKLLDDDTLQRGLKRMEQRKEAEIKPKRERLARIEKLIEQCNSKIERLMSEWSDEEDKDLLAESKIVIKRENDKRKGLVKERDTLKDEIAREEFSPEIQHRIRTTVADLKGKIDNATFAKKRYIMDKLDVRLILRNDEVGRWLDGTCGISDFRVEITSSTLRSRSASASTRSILAPAPD